MVAVTVRSWRTASTPGHRRSSPTRTTCTPGCASTNRSRGSSRPASTSSPATTTSTRCCATVGWGAPTCTSAPTRSSGTRPTPSTSSRSGGWCRHGMLDREPPDHTRLRRLVSKAFTPRRVEQLRPTVERLADELVDDLLAAGGGDLIATVAEPLPVDRHRRAARRAARGPARCCGRGRRHLRHVRAEPVPGDRRHGRTGVRGVLRRTCAASPGCRRGRSARRPHHRARRRSRRGRPLTEDELIGTCVLLLNAGHEATVNVTGNGWWALFRNPDQLAALRGRRTWLLPRRRSRS